MKLLEGVRVLDLTRMLSGPYGSMLLADMGAQVIKVEEVRGGDAIRKMGPPFINGESAYFISINRNKKSIAIDLKKDEGREVFYKLVKNSDVVFDNFRPGILEKLKCDYNTLKNYNPSIVSCSITSFGEEEPMRNLPAFDLIIQAYSGAMSITGEPGKTPVRMGIPMGDLAGGIYAALAISSALVKREKTGKGSRISVSLLDCLVGMLTYVAQYYFTDGKIPEPQGSKHMSCVPYGAYKTKDMHIVIGVFTEKFWDEFCKAIGHTELINDERFITNQKRVKNRNILEPMIEKILLKKPASEWLKKLQKYNVPCAPVNTLDLVFQMKQLIVRNMAVELNHPIAGKVKTLGYPIKTKDDQENTPSPSPLLGENTEEILSSLANISKDEYNNLKNKKIIA